MSTSRLLGPDHLVFPPSLRLPAQGRSAKSHRFHERCGGHPELERTLETRHRKLLHQLCHGRLHVFVKYVKSVDIVRRCMMMYVCIVYSDFPEYVQHMYTIVEIC